MDLVEFYTDGACSQNGTWKGGWATVVVIQGFEVQTFSGSEEDTTNNRMELMAFKKALEVINERQERGTVFTDSAYITNCFKDKWYINWRKNGWRNAKKEPVANQDLWKEIIRLYEENTNLITIEKVKGHSNNKFNNLADRRAVEASK